jgi:hypothetical protein
MGNIVFDLVVDVVSVNVIMNAGVGLLLMVLRLLLLKASVVAVVAVAVAVDVVVVDVAVVVISAGARGDAVGKLNYTRSGKPTAERALTCMQVLKFFRTDLGNDTTIVSYPSGGLSKQPCFRCVA